MNSSLGAVSCTDPAVILPERRVSYPVTADLYTLALDTQVGGLVIGAGGPVYHIVSGVVIFLRSHKFTLAPDSPPHLGVSVVARQLTLEVGVFILKRYPDLTRPLLILRRRHIEL